MDSLVFERALSPSPGATGAVISPIPLMNPPPSSVAELFEQEESGLLRFAIGLVGRRSVAEDLVQETFLRLHPVWSEVENPRGWVYRTCRNLALNHLRDHPREAELDEAIAPADQPPPADVMGRDEAVGMVKLLLTEISDEDRNLVLLKYQHDLKYQEISQRTGLSVSNVGYRLHHVLKGLADALRRAGIEGSRG